MTLFPILCFVILTAGAITGKASLVVTPLGQSLGFTTSTVLSAVPEGPAYVTSGLALTGNGNFLLDSNNTRYIFADIDGQTLANAISSVPSTSEELDYASVGGKIYGTVVNPDYSSPFAQFNNDGTVNHVLLPTLSSYGAIVGNPSSGKLIAFSSAGLIEIDPIANTFRVIAANSLITYALAVSPDGGTVYGSNGAYVIGYSIATGAVVFTSNSFSKGPSALAVINSSNNLNGSILVATSFNGLVNLLNPTTLAVTIIAKSDKLSGGPVAPDASNGTLLMEFSDANNFLTDYKTEISRLSCGPDCSFSSSLVTPEPGSLTLIAFGAAGLGCSKLLRRRGTKRV